MGRDLGVKNVVVTGGSGFIGTHLVEQLVRAGLRVVNVDLRPPEIPAHQDHWVQGDLLDAVRVSRLVVSFQPEVVVNLAANADIGSSGDALRVNTEGVRVLLHANSQLASPARLIHASTQFVAQPGYWPTGPRDYAPYTEYGESKAKSEEILWEQGGDDWTIVRPTIVWGPIHRGMARTTMRYLQRRLYVIPTGRSSVRSYGYVRNVVAQLIQATRLPATDVNRRMFYVGDKPIPSATWLDAMSRELTGHPVRRVPEGFFRVGAEVGELLSRAGAPAPLNRGRLFRMTTDAPVPMDEGLQVLGEGSVSLDEAVRETATWLRQEYPSTF